MADDLKSTETPTNLELAREARTTRDCERQVALARHPSLVVRKELARNRALCSAAIEALGNELEELRLEIQREISEAGEHLGKKS